MKSISKYLLAVILVAVSSVAYSQVSKNIRYLGTPTVYEGKTATSFKVEQVYDDGALAVELSDKELDLYLGKTVLILGDFFYNEQIVEIKNPMFVGVYKTSSKTVPVVKQSTPPSVQEERVNDNTNAEIGNSASSAKTGSNNSWSLDGRSIRGAMALPTYGEQEEGTIVIRITVNENGDVIIADIGPGTDISSKKLHNAAIAAAKKTKFNSLPGKKNQTGTITYKFELR